MADGIKICSSNCQGLGDHQKRRDVLQYLRQSKYSIICLQDTHFSKANERRIQQEWGYKAYFSSFDSKSRGVAIFLNNNFEFTIHNSFSDNSGNFLMLDIEISKKRMTIVNIYGPNKDDPVFYENLRNNVIKFNNNDVLIVGDWNLLLNPEIDGYNYKHVNNPKARYQVLRLMNDLNLFDVWREENQEEKKFTWRRKIQNQRLQMGRLDFFLVSESLINFSCNEEIYPGYRSDHSIIELTLKLCKNTSKGRTFWKFNNSLLYNTEYINEVKKSILKIKEQYAAYPYNREQIHEIDNEQFETVINPQLFLEMILLDIRSISIAFSTALKKKDNDTMSKLESQIKNLENSDPTKHFEEINSMKVELQEIREKKLRGSLIRSRARWIEHGERASKYFCNLENRNYVSKRMTSLIKSDGREVMEASEIKNEVYEFYSSLYTSREQDIQNINLTEILDNDTPILRDDEALAIEGPITFTEAGITLRKMQNNRSPGSTGFTTEFFKFFWKDLGHMVVKSLNFGFNKGELSTTQKEGIITCIPKGGKSRKHIKNWRPISLLNITYKIGSGCISNRLKTVLPSIIHRDQSGFIAGRFTGDNIRLIYDILNFSNCHKKKGLMLLIDFEKAFDSVAWSFMEKCLKFYNFKNDIICWIKTFYRNIKSTVIVNNDPTMWFPIERGVRQGDPISPYIFLLCGEVLAHMIRQNDEIKGYKILGCETKISQYADDTSLLLDGSSQSFEACVHTVLEYAKYSGLAMNFDKTKVVWFGCVDTPKEVFLPDLNFEWNPPTFTILGVEFTRDLKNITEINIERKLAEMQHEINNWAKRDLTPFGKVTVIKTLIISKIVHILISLPTPNKKIVIRINRMLYEFLWDGKPDKISRNVAKQKLENGGIAMIDIEIFDKALKMTWIRRILVGDPMWKKIITRIHPNIMDIPIYGNSFVLDLSKCISNPFWRNVMCYLYEFQNKIQITNFKELGATCFLYNENIKIGGSVITNNICKTNKIFFIKQLMDNDRFLAHDEFLVKYNIKIDFLTYYSIIRAIKTFAERKQLDYSNINIDQPPAINMLLKCKKGASKLYRVFLKYNLQCKGMTKWANLTGIDKEEWLRSFSFLKNTTSDTKLIWLQFRILHSILTTNRSVSKFKQNQSHLCSFCNQHSETIQHLLWKCETVRIFWDELTFMLNARCRHAHNFKVNEKLVLFGKCDMISTDNICDLILLLAKSFIYKCKVQGRRLNKGCFIREIYNRYSVEKYIARNSTEFINKWRPYEELFKSLM